MLADFNLDAGSPNFFVYYDLVGFVPSAI